MFLTATDQKIEAVLSGAVSANQVQFVAAYADITTTTFVPGQNDGVTNDTTDVDVVTAPASSTQRQIKSLSFYNADSSPAEITVKLDNGGTDRVLIKNTLQPGDTLSWAVDTGWVKGIIGSPSFLDLPDTPSSYSGHAGAIPAVNSGETALEFVTVANSVFGRTGAVSAQSGDYDAGQIDETSSAKIMTGSERTKLAGIESGAEVNDVDSVFGRTGAVTAQSGDYSFLQLGDTPGNYTGDANKIVSVNGAEDALVFLSQGSGGGLNADQLDGQEGSFYQNASNLNTGTLADARVAQSNVTQHQGALSIAGSQLTGTVPNARLESTVFITGDTLIAAGGSAGSPGIRFNGDADTGLYHPSADTIAVSIGGAQIGYWDSGGLEIPTGGLIAGDPGTEEGGITVNGVTYESHLKVSHLGSGSHEAQFIMHRHSTTIQPIIVGSRSHTDDDSHAVVQDGDGLLTLMGVGWDGTDYAFGAQIDMIVDGTPGSNDMPTRIDFSTSADGSQSPTTALRLTSAQQALFDDGSGASPGIGFISDPDTGMFHPAADTLAWSFGGSQFMQADGSNLLIGKTDAGVGVEGLRLDGVNGYFTVTRDGEQPVDLNRLTSEGNVLRIQKDGSTVGSIGTQSWFIGDTANANMMQGLTINQGAADDEILALKSSDVAHGATDETETDSWGVIKKRGTAGGLRLEGYYSSGIVGLWPVGTDSTDNTNKSSSAAGTVLVESRKISGTGTAAHGANHNSWVLREAGSTIAIIDVEGDIHNDGSGTLNTFDEHDDVDLLEGLRADLLGPDRAAENGLGEKVGLHRNVLESRGVVTYNDSDGRHFVSMKGLSALQTDAMRQMKAAIKDQEARLSALENSNAARQ